MSYVTDRMELGYFPLQDFSSERRGEPLSRRQSLGGVRIERIPTGDQITGRTDSLIEIARENGLGTAGDVHPWLFWQTRERVQRGSGAWAQMIAALAVDIDTHYGTTAAQPIFDSEGRHDVRFAHKAAWMPRGLPRIPAGALIAMAPGTDEEHAQEVPLWVDPRLVAAHVGGPGECGTLVCDLQPDGELCMSGSDLPGIGGRHARLQSLVRVVAVRPGQTLGDLGGGPGNVLALNFAATGVDRVPGFGAIFAPVLGGGGPTTGGGGGPVTGGSNAASAPPSSTPNGIDRFGSLLPTDSSNEARTPADFGRFLPRPARGHAVALLESMAGSGPIHAGAETDKHRHGADADGNPINAAHISTGAFFFADAARDAPLEFGGFYPHPPPMPLKSKVHLSYDPLSFHGFRGAIAPGLWRWWCEVPYFAPTTEPPTTPPPRLPPGGPTTPGPGGPSTPGAPGQPGRPTTPPPRPPRPGKPTTPPRNPGGGGGPNTPRGPRPGAPLMPGPPFTDPGLHQLPPKGRGGKLYPPGAGEGGGQDPGEGPTTPGSGGGTCREYDTRSEAFAALSDSLFFDPRLSPAQLAQIGNGTRRAFVSDYGAPGDVWGVDPRGELGRWSGRNPWTREPEVVPGLVERVGGAGLEARSLYSIFHPLHETFGAFSFRPQIALRGAPNFERNPQLHAGMIEQEERARPHVLTMRAWGAHDTDAGDWSYVEQPATARSRGGTANGGVLLCPPRFEPEDYFEIGPARDVDDTTGDDATRAYLALAPGVSLALGKPALDGGVSDDTVTVRQDPTSGRVGVLVETATGDALLSAYAESADVIVELGRDGKCAVKLPVGSAAERPAGVAGLIRVNSDGASDVIEYYDSQSASWKTLAVD